MYTSLSLSLSLPLCHMCKNIKHETTHAKFSSLASQKWSLGPTPCGSSKKNSNIKSLVLIGLNHT